MAISNIRTASAVVNNTTVDLVDGSGNNRIAIVVTMQERTTENLAPVTFDGVAMTQAGTTVSSSNIQHAAIYYMLDAQLPATGGTYSVVGSGLGSVSVSAITASGIDQAVNSDFGSFNTDGTGTTLTLTSAASGALLVGGLVRNASSGTLSIGAGQTAILSDTAIGSARFISSYNTDDNDQTYTSSSSQPTAMLAASFDPAPAGSGPTVTTPVTGTNETNIQFTGTDCDTITGASMVVDGVERNTLNITAQTTTTINLDVDTEAGSATLGVPVSGVPFEPTIIAAGTTPYAVAVRVTDGVDSNDLGFEVNPDSQYDVIQTTIAVANTTSSESIFGTSWIDVEDDTQARVRKAVGSMNVTWADDGTFTTDANQTASTSVEFYSPSTGQWSKADLVITADGIVLASNAGDWIAQQGGSGQVNEAWITYLKGQGASGSTYNELMYDWLGGLGYTGSLTDRFAAWSKDNLLQ